MFANKTKITYAIIIIALLFYIEQFFAISYIWKTILKIVLFVSPIILYREKLSFKTNKHTKKAIVCGIILVGLILATYFILQSFIDLQSITTELEQKQNITRGIFILVAAYIILGNSLIEEFFFRGFLKNNTIMSAILFSVYHTAIFWTWFSPLIIAIALIGLFAGGLLFAHLNNKETILNGLIVHIGADIGIIIVGLMMFGFF